MDGTFRPLRRPTSNQKILLNVHRRIHAINVQSDVAYNGLIANLHGPDKGKNMVVHLW